MDWSRSRVEESLTRAPGALVDVASPAAASASTANDAFVCSVTRLELEEIMSIGQSKSELQQYPPSLTVS